MGKPLLVKPGGVPRINWAHSLAKDLVVCITPETGDLLTSTPIILNAAGAISKTPYGSSIQSTSAANAGGAVSAAYLNLPTWSPLYSVGAQHTVVMGVWNNTQNNPTGYSTYLSVPVVNPYGDPYAAIALTIDTAGGWETDIAFSTNPATQYFQSVTSINPATDLRIVGWSRNGTTQAVYENGVAGTNGGSANASSLAPTWVNHRPLCILGDVENNSASGNVTTRPSGHCLFTYIFKRALTAAEQQSLSNDPYALLEFSSENNRLLALPPTTPQVNQKSPAALKPGGAPRINWGHPLARDLVICATPEAGELLTGTKPTFLGSAKLSTGPAGTEFDSVNTTSDISFALPPWSLVYDPTIANFTVFVIAHTKTLTTGAVSGTLFSIGYDAANDGIWLGSNNTLSNDKGEFDYHTNTGLSSQFITTNTYWSASDPAAYAVVRDVVAQKTTFFKDGTLFEQFNDTRTETLNISVNKRSLDLFNFDATTAASFAGSMQIAFMFRRALTAAEMKQLYEDPFAILDFGTGEQTRPITQLLPPQPAPLANQKSPRLLKPGNIPRLNWSHPLAKELLFALPSEGRDLISQVSPLLFGSGASIAPSPEGRSLTVTDGTSYGVYGVEHSIEAAIRDSYITSITFAFYLRPSSSLASTYLYYDGATTELSLTAAGHLSYNYVDTIAIPQSDLSSADYVTTTPAFYSVSRSEAADITFYRDGAVFSTTSPTSSGNSSLTIEVDLLGGSSHASTPGSMPIFFIFRRALTTAEHALLARDPLALFDYGLRLNESSAALLKTTAVTPIWLPGYYI
jgi:hypothetical protein